MSSGPDYIVDIEGVTPPRGGGADASRGATGKRPWLAVMWECCSVYSRVYRNHGGSAYEGKCPKCGKAVNVPIGPGGTSNRFFRAR